MHHNSLKAIIFDVGDILYDASVWRKWLTAELRNMGVDTTYEQLVQEWEKHLVNVYKGSADYWPSFRALLESLGIAKSQMDHVEHAAKEKGRAVQVERSPMPQVPETLAVLKQSGIKLVALSDTESGESSVRATLRQLGIEHNFDAVVCSHDIGHAKPEPEAFETAVRATGCKREQCGFVGHDFDELQGARDFGLFVISYNSTVGFESDAAIECFSELIRVTAK